MEGYPRYFSFSVSHTTRPPREDETDGVQYWFCTQDQMKLDIDKGRFFEHVRFLALTSHTHIVFLIIMFTGIYQRGVLWNYLSGH